MSKKAWRIYHNDAITKTELTQSPERVRQAREKGLKVVPLVELPIEQEHDCHPVNYTIVFGTLEGEQQYVKGWI